MLIDGWRSRNLMLRDDFKNLGFGEEKVAAGVAEGKKEEGAGVKGELRW